LSLSRERGVGSRARHVLTRLAKLPFYPIVFAVVAVMQFALESGVSASGAFRALAIAALVTAVLTTTLGIVLRDRWQGAFVALMLGLLLWSRDLVHSAWTLAAEAGPLTALPGLVGLLAVAVLLARIVASRVQAGWAARAANRLNIFTALLAAVVIVGAIPNGQLAATIGPIGGSRLLSAGDVPPSREDPDIWVLLLDGYARADVLSVRFDFDNSQFLADLRARGLKIAQQSHTAYLWTRPVLTSMFHMAYLDDIPAMRPLIDGPSILDGQRRVTLNQSPVFEFARAHGYHIRTVSPGFEHVALRDADEFLDSGEMSDFELELVNSTFLGDIADVVHPDLEASQLRSRIQRSCDVATEPSYGSMGPALTFIHVPAPHGPFVLGATGEAVTVAPDDAFFQYADGRDGTARDEYARRYTDELQFVSGLALQCVDVIVAEARVPPVVIVLSDHGSSSRVSWLRTDPTEADPQDVLERTATFFAALTPDHQDVFPDDVVTVDVFRHLFDAYLGTNLGRAVPPASGSQIPPVDASVLTRGG